jgi:hypothetical protein
MAFATLVLATAADADVQGPVETVHACIKTCVPAKTVTHTVEPNSSSRRKHTMFLTCAKTMSAVAVAVLFSLVAMDGATAEGGCGPGFHRNEFGRCRADAPGCYRWNISSLSCTCRFQCAVELWNTAKLWDRNSFIQNKPLRDACVEKCVAAKTAAQH